MLTRKTITDIAIEANVSKDNLYKWSKGAKPRTIEELQRFIDYLDKSKHQPKHPEKVQPASFV